MLLNIQTICIEKYFAYWWSPCKMERVSEWCWCFVDMSAEPSSQNNNNSVSVELLFSHISVACSLAVSKRNATWQYAHTSNSRETTQIILLASVFLWLSLRTSPFLLVSIEGGGHRLLLLSPLEIYSKAKFPTRHSYMVAWNRNKKRWILLRKTRSTRTTVAVNWSPLTLLPLMATPIHLQFRNVSPIAVFSTKSKPTQTTEV